MAQISCGFYVNVSEGGFIPLQLPLPCEPDCRIPLTRRRVAVYPYALHLCDFQPFFKGVLYFLARSVLDMR